jgi:AraC family transcriptional regulator
MATSDAYGQRLGERMRVDNAPAIFTRVLPKTDIAVTEIRCDHPLPGMSGSLQREDAFLVVLLLRDFPGKEAGKRPCTTCGQARSVSMT